MKASKRTFEQPVYKNDREREACQKEEKGMDDGENSICKCLGRYDCS